MNHLRDLWGGDRPIDSTTSTRAYNDLPSQHSGGTTTSGCPGLLGSMSREVIEITESKERIIGGSFGERVLSFGKGPLPLLPSNEMEGQFVFNF